MHRLPGSWTSTLTRLGFKRKKRATKQLYGRRLSIETLEPRKLLTASSFEGFVGPILDIETAPISYKVGEFVLTSADWTGKETLSDLKRDQHGLGVDSGLPGTEAGKFDPGESWSFRFDQPGMLLGIQFDEFSIDDADRALLIIGDGEPIAIEASRVVDGFWRPSKLLSFEAGQTLRIEALTPTAGDLDAATAARLAKRLAEAEETEGSETQGEEAEKVEEPAPPSSTWRVLGLRVLGEDDRTLGGYIDLAGPQFPDIPGFPPHKNDSAAEDSSGEFVASGAFLSAHVDITNFHVVSHGLSELRVSYEVQNADLDDEFTIKIHRSANGTTPVGDPLLTYVVEDDDNQWVVGHRYVDIIVDFQDVYEDYYLLAVAIDGNEDEFDKKEFSGGLFLNEHDYALHLHGAFNSTNDNFAAWSYGATIDGNSYGYINWQSQSIYQGYGELPNLHVRTHGGNDTIHLDDHDQLGTRLFAWGGAGNDTITGSHGNDLIYGGSGYNNLYGGPGDDALFGGEDIDSIYGQDGNDTIEGGGPALGYGQGDYLLGGDGDDEIQGSGWADWIDGGAGHDSIQAGNEEPQGASAPWDSYGYGGGGYFDYGGGDYILGGIGDDIIDAGYGNDFVSAGIGHDYVDGGLDDDYLIGGPADDHYSGMDHDRLFGNDGDDEIHGGAGNDYLSGGEGEDTVHGCSGDDIYIAINPGFFFEDVYVDDPDVPAATPDIEIVPHQSTPALGVVGSPEQSTVVAEYQGTASPGTDVLLSVVTEKRGATSYDASADVRITPEGEVIWTPPTEADGTLHEIYVEVIAYSAYESWVFEAPYYFKLDFTGFVGEPTSDEDGDGLDNETELTIEGTSPLDFDSDHDLLGDGFEAGAPHLDPLTPDDPSGDYDGDGLTELGEQIHGTDPAEADSDGDGTSDGVETGQGSDPNDPSDLGEAPPEDEVAAITLTVWDDSGSHSEMWALEVGNKRHQTPDYGSAGSGTYVYKKGESYDVSLDWLDTDPDYEDGPDFDWFADVDPADGTLIVLHNPWFEAANDAQLQLLGHPFDTQHEDNFDQVNDANGQDAELHIPLVKLDITESLNGAVPNDEEEIPGGYLLWNNDDDNENGIADYLDETADGSEDDFLELKLSSLMPAALQSLPGTLTLTFNTDEVDRIKIWRDTTKSDEVESGESFSLSEDAVLYVEGIAGSAALRDEPIIATYAPGSLGPDYVVKGSQASDAVNLTVIHGNLTLEGVAEEVEETLGGVVFYNDNDSDDNDIMDILDDVGRTTTDVDWAILQIDPVAPFGLSGTYSLAFPGEIRIWRDNGNGTFSYMQSGFTMDAAAPPALYVEGFSPDGEGDITLSFTGTDGTHAPKIDKVRARSEIVAVEWAKIADNQSSSEFNEAEGRLEHEKAIDKNRGAYIPLNDDDDDYDGQADSGNTQELSEQENDLLPIYIHKMPKDTGNGDYTYSLSKTPALRLWTKNGDGSYRPFSNDDLDFGGGSDELEFYVDANSDPGDLESLTLRVEHPRAARPFLQRIYVNVFGVQGPRNVPDYSVYEYKTSDFATRAGTMWVAPGFGQLREGDSTPNDGTDSVRNFWNESPIIAKARYQATSDYVWAFDVNVVEIVLGDGTLNNSNGLDPFLDFPGESVRAVSATGQGNYGLESTYQIDEMTGPTRGDSQQRGVEKMLVGYMQILTSTTYNATYANNHHFAHVMQGRSYVDVLSLQGQTTVFPWYDSGNLSSQGVIGKGVLRGTDYLTIVGQGGTPQIAMSDTPIPIFPLRDPDPNRTGALQTANFDWDFRLIVAVGTLEVDIEDRPIPPGDRYPFFRRATSEWSYSGVINRTGAALADVALASNGIEIAAAWTEEQDGQLAFDQEVRRNIANGVPFKANDVINGGEGNGIWFEQ